MICDAQLASVAIGRLVVGAFALKRGHIRSLTVDELHVGRLDVRELLVDRGSRGRSPEL